VKGSAVWTNGKSRSSHKSSRNKPGRKPAAHSSTPLSARTAAAQILTELIKGRGNLSSLLEPMQIRVADDQQPLLQELVFGGARHFQTLEFLAAQLLAKPLRKKDGDVYALILLGIYQLRYLRVPSHAAINLTVESVDELGKNWATGLVNAVLRNYQRQFVQPENVASDSLNTSDVLDKSVGASSAQDSEDLSAATGKVTEQARFSHPQWIIDTLRSTWTDEWQDILLAANARPPLSLRINTGASSPDEYLQELSSNDIGAQLHAVVSTAIVLDKPQSVHQLPGFSEGVVSVQDASAQLAVELLRSDWQLSTRRVDTMEAEQCAGASDAVQSTPQPVPGKLEILDACAAPGGKTGHLLEVFPESHVTAVDVSEKRMQRVRENLDRLKGTDRVELVTADASDPSDWWNGQLFDIVLVDAPCSGSGVIRRQPDIKLLRNASDVAELATLQHKMIDSLWPLLKPGGKLLYVTCSVFRQENDQQMRQFLSRHENAQEVALQQYLGASLPHHPVDAGLQILTGTLAMDGFYYCLLEKVA